ncbi:hypothetical protein TWF694_010315 [Orbilia ellipsospora]|uniref:Uncharacterized protein n=1 Tax=Orbilia ellipsospora TaxID=2528407 RepID=A0AAV9X9I8_9PEZI
MKFLYSLVSSFLPLLIFITLSIPAPTAAIPVNRAHKFSYPPYTLVVIGPNGIKTTLTVTYKTITWNGPTQTRNPVVPSTTDECTNTATVTKWRTKTKYRTKTQTKTETKVVMSTTEKWHTSVVTKVVTKTKTEKETETDVSTVTETSSGPTVTETLRLTMTVIGRNSTITTSLGKHL